MEAIIFCGIQATGKTTFYKEQFLKTHIRISMDMLNTRNKENRFLETCLSLQQPFVIDNTNPSKIERNNYIIKAKSHKFRVVGYYFCSKLNESILRNSTRIGKEYIREIGIRGTFKKLELPAFEEGFDQLYYVTLTENGFKVENWEHEI